jgi:hypothetical protein
MNKRILELAKQCGYWSGQTIEMNDVGIEKFAELIVRECADIVDRAEPYKANDLILKHFGIEE